MKKKKKPKTWTLELSQHLSKSGKHDTGFDFLTDYPQAIESLIKRLHDICGDDKKAVINLILSRLRIEAEATLKRKNYPTSLNELTEIDPYKMDIEAASARAVLLYAGFVKDDIENNDSVQTMIDTMLLISSAIRASGFDFAFEGLRMTFARVKSHTKKKLQGILLAIEQLRQEDPGLLRKRGAIWERLSDLAKANTPWTLAKDGITYKITSGDKNMLTHEETTKNKTIVTPLKKNTFIKHYF